MSWESSGRRLPKLPPGDVKAALFDVIERCGGMLIFGAIITCEYGPHCITDVPRSIALISNGGRITKDGYLCIVALGGMVYTGDGVHKSSPID